MTNKAEFMETLRLVAEIARTTDGILTREEIQVYFKDMELTKEQQDMVYEYLLNPKNYQEEEKQENQEEDSQEPEETDKKLELEKVSAHFQMYLDEIKELPVLSKEEQQQLYQSLLLGEEGVIQQISNQWLIRVIELVKDYVSEYALLEDLIQEGNIGLLMGLRQLAVNGKKQDIEVYLSNCVQEAVENYLEEEFGDESREQSILAKATLIQKSARFLANEKGAIPSMLELAEYTGLEEKEVSDIMALVKEREVREQLI